MENFGAGEMLRKKEAAEAYKKMMKDGSEKNQATEEKLEYNEKEILKLAKEGGFSSKKLKRVYRELAMENHPDRLASQNLTEEEKKKRREKMKTINERYGVLSEKL